MEAPLARLLAMSLRLLLDEMHRRLADQGFAGLRPAYGFALNGVGDGVTTAQLAHIMGMTKQGAAKLVGNLVDDGYLSGRPHEQDGRATLLTLTDRGRDLLSAAAAVQGELEEELARSLGRHDVAAARRALRALVEEYGDGSRPALRPAW
ncbi:MAG: MarR family winged helix-turn-helix transcriptional regulator [Kineosporiaceae bacterium]|jgi:DNA-binding MarR family transcriptional regulator